MTVKERKSLLSISFQINKIIRHKKANEILTWTSLQFINTLIKVFLDLTCVLYNFPLSKLICLETKNFTLCEFRLQHEVDLFELPNGRKKTFEIIKMILMHCKCKKVTSFWNAKALTYARHIFHLTETQIQFHIFCSFYLYKVSSDLSFLDWLVLLSIPRRRNYTQDFEGLLKHFLVKQMRSTILYFAFHSAFESIRQWD